MAKEFDGEFNCLGEKTEKIKILSAPTTKEVKRIGKIGEEITKTISYKLQFIESARFMASSLSSLVDNLGEGIHKINVNMDMILKNVKRAESNLKLVSAALNTQTLKMI